MNNTLVVGRLTEKPALNKNSKKCSIMLAVPRNYKNYKGVYETDFIPVKLSGELAKTTCEYCQKGDVVAVRGRIARLSGEDLEIIAEKVSFLATGHQE